MQLLKFLAKWIAILVAVLAVVLLAGGSMLSPDFNVSRAITIEAPPERVYALVADPRAWKRWSVWNERDPAMRITYSGPESGAGAAWAWESKTEGDGKMTITAAEPPKRVAFDLFFPDVGTTSKGDISFGQDGSGTRVTWTMRGSMGSNPLQRWFALGADKLIGPDFESGLRNLKNLAEKG